MNNRNLVVGLLALSCLAAHPAHPAQAAEKCTLLKIAALKMKPLPSGDYAIPVSIGGVQRDFALSFSAPFSAITGALADAQGYKTVDLPDGLTPRLNGEKVKQKVIVGDLAVGVSHGSGFEMLRTTKMVHDESLAGLVGLDLLENFDVELNLSKLELNLFAHSDCEDKVYWALSYADTNIRKDVSGHFSFGMYLDDTHLSVDLDVSDGPSGIGTNTLKRIFDLTPESPGMTTEVIQGTTIWHYPFKVLSLDGVTVNNPHIAIIRDDGPECRSDVPGFGGWEDRCYGTSSLTMHGDTLKALHLYFAFKEKKVYITAADAHL